MDFLCSVSPITLSCAGAARSAASEAEFYSTAGLLEYLSHFFRDLCNGFQEMIKWHGALWSESYGNETGEGEGPCERWILSQQE